MSDFLQTLAFGGVGAFMGLFHGAFLAIIVHELGHLVFGKLTGYSFVSFRVSSFVWYKENGKIMFSRSKSIAAGQCLMDPPENPEKFKFVWYNLGGGIFNLLLAGVWWGIYVITSAIAVDGVHWFWVIFFIIGIVYNVLTALINLLPFIVGGMPVDGRNVREALKSKDAKHGLYMMLYINGQLAKGKRYRDFPQELFLINKNADIRNYFVAYMLMLEAERQYDIGNHEASMDIMNRLSHIKLPAVYRNGILLEQLHYYTIHHRDLQKAAAIYANKKIKRIFTHSKTIDFSWVIAAYEYFGLGNKEKAEKILTRAHKQLVNHPNMGARMMYKDLIENVEKLIREDDMVIAHEENQEKVDVTELASLLQEANAWKESERD